MRKIWKSFVAGLVVASLLVGCGGHVTLQAPAMGAPEAERLRAYEQLRPVDRSVSRKSMLSDDPGRPARTTHRTDFIVIGSGQKVEHVDDLLAVVPPDSDVAKDARASVAYDWLGAGLIVLGVVAAGTAGVLLFSSSENEYSNGLLWGTSAGAGVLIGAGVGVRVHSGHRASRAFTAYDHSLRRRLDLCETRGVLATCKHLPPVEP